MRAYVVRRILLIIPTLFLLSILVFLSARFIPGDIVDTMMASDQNAMFGVDREALLHALGLDVPVHVQYGRWLEGLLLRGTLGNSLLGDWPVEEKIADRLPVTLELGLLAIVIGLVIGVPIGIFSAIRQDTTVDYVGRSVAVAGLAAPNFWLGIMVMTYPSVWWGWAPPMRLTSFADDPLGNLEMFIIPSLILGTALSAATMRMTRTMMLEVLRQDYIRTAWSKGLKERVVVIRHAIKNALIPVVTLIGLQLPILVGGAVIISEASLSFLGFGLSPEIPSWGTLLSRDGRKYMEQAPWLALWPGLCLTLTVYSLNMFGDAVRDLLDPRLRGGGGRLGTHRGRTGRAPQTRSGRRRSRR